MIRRFIIPAAGLALVTPVALVTLAASAASAAASMPAAAAAARGVARAVPVTAYVANLDSGNVTPIRTAVDRAAGDQDRRRPCIHRDHAGRQDRLRRQ